MRPAGSLALLATLAASALPAQRAAGPTPLDALVQEALAANPRLRAAALAVDHDAAALGEARGRFLPSVTANARASTLFGATPNLGALINPAYAALNQLLGQSAFPTNITLTLPQRQEATVRVAQPLFEPRVLEGVRIARAQRDASIAGRDAQRRQLAADIQLGYLQYARASRAAELYAATVPLLDEALRVSERLLSAGKVTPDNVLRARAEQAAVVQQRDAARQLASAARQQLNYLAGRPIDADLPLFADTLLDFEARFTRAMDLPAARARALDAREELTQLDRSSDAVQGQRRIAQAAFLPSVNLAVDYGFQGNAIRVGRNTDFAVASLVLSWNLFNGGQDRARMEQASLGRAQLAAQRDDAARSITLQVTVAHDAAVLARTAIGTAADRLAAATRTFELVQRRFGEGLASQLELLDARTALTGAQVNQLLTTYDFHQRVVEFERAAALTPIR
ncbi:MAG: TolC family protein [Gemmatimonadaceae bacterium]|nr:TolC family protein [Gemmatimonadaceae bacterium]